MLASPQQQETRSDPGRLHHDSRVVATPAQHNALLTTILKQHGRHAIPAIPAKPTQPPSPKSRRDAAASTPTA
ncbi:hypothetical protein CCHR01_13185 [Colletotrichum chrysophilum]|uniref:Uncharacterized protein n=1 Tax=Colletotrichum chrysophilum TaxID=1836956 RepID=A0AAD9EAQ2_9PEZI|nr:hypothetical protein CCHR01_13185 [Colletotrichum chrysophilum]